MTMAPLTYWAERIGELIDRSGWSTRSLSHLLGISHHAVQAWSKKDKDPRLALAVQVSLLLGYTLDSLTSPDPLGLAHDFTTLTLDAGLASWRRIVWREQLLALVPGARTRRDAIVTVADRALLPIRTVSGWVYEEKEPQLACASVVAVGFGVSLHSLAIGGAP